MAFTAFLEVFGDCCLDYVHFFKVKHMSVFFEKTVWMFAVAWYFFAGLVLFWTSLNEFGYDVWRDSPTECL